MKSDLAGLAAREAARPAPDLHEARVELLHELSAENTRLRREIQNARKDERAAIVAHLRRDYLTLDMNTATFFADCIEQEHDRWGSR